MSDRGGASSFPRLNLLVAAAQNGVIGRENALPWHLPEDLKRFKELTMGQVCLMGRSTYESIGRVLPGRIFAVLSSRPSFCPPDVRVFSSVAPALEALANQKEVYVIGGGSVYAELMPFASRLFLTRIYAHLDGDTYFQFSESEWEIECRSGRLTSKSGLEYEFIDYRRRS
jgi:dihydrofolate reductase